RRPEDTAAKIALQTERDDSTSSVEEPAEDNAETTRTRGPLPPHSGPQDRYIAPEMKSYTQVYRFGHQVLVPTLIGDASLKLFLLDIRIDYRDGLVDFAYDSKRWAH